MQFNHNIASELISAEYGWSLISIKDCPMRTLLLCVIVVLTLSLPCVAKEKPPGYKTPEAAIRAYVTGVYRQNAELLISSCTPRTRAFHFGLAAFSISYAYKDEGKIKKLMNEHGIEEVIKKYEALTAKFHKEKSLVRESKNNNWQQAEEDKVFVRCMLEIKDGTRLLQKILDERRESRAEELREEHGDVNMKDAILVEKALAAMKVVDMKIKRNTASCSIDSDLATGKSSSKGLAAEKIVFKLRRIDGRWFCDHDPR